MKIYLAYKLHSYLKIQKMIILINSKYAYLILIHISVNYLEYFVSLLDLNDF